MTRPRIVVADDHDETRAVIASRLASDFDVVSTVADGQAAVEAAGALYPDLVVLDISMPGLNGFEAAALIRDLPNPPRIVFATVYEDASIASAASALGASAVVRKREMLTELGAGNPPGAVVPRRLFLRRQSVARRHRRPLHRRGIGGQPGGRDCCDGIAQRLHPRPVDGDGCGFPGTDRARRAPDVRCRRSPEPIDGRQSARCGALRRHDQSDRGQGCGQQEASGADCTARWWTCCGAAAGKMRRCRSRFCGISSSQDASARFSAAIRRVSAQPRGSTRFVIGTATSCRRTPPCEGASPSSPRS